MCASRAQAARKLRASTRSPSKTSSHMLSQMSPAARFKQWHALSFCQAVSKLCGRACCLSVGSRVCCWPGIAGSDLSGKRLCGLLCERQTHCLEKLARNPHENFANRGQQSRVSASLCARKCRASAAQGQSRAKEYRTTPMCVLLTQPTAG